MNFEAWDLLRDVQIKCRYGNVIFSAESVEFFNLFTFNYIRQNQYVF